jgi:hypothetical protein
MDSRALNAGSPADVQFSRNDRGLAFVELKNSNGGTVRVQRSSLAPLDRVWLASYCEPHGEPQPYLDADQCRALAAALLAFADGRDHEEVER